MPMRVNSTLTKIFRPAIKNSAFLIRLKVSSEKVENVVSPPQKPIPIKSLTVGFIKPFSSQPKIINPRMKLPSKFTINVPKGKNIGRCLDAYVESQNLNVLPIPPPMNTVINFINCSSMLKSNIPNLSFSIQVKKFYFERCNYCGSL